MTAAAQGAAGEQIVFLCTDFPDEAWRGVRSEVAQLLSGIGAAVRPVGFSLVVRRCNGEEGRQLLHEVATAPGVRGVILRPAGVLEDETVDILARARKPFVAIKRRAAGRAINTVVSDDLSGARMATDHLIGRGHRRIGLICARPELSMVQDRLAGYERALTEAGIQVDRELVRLASGFTHDAGGAEIRDLVGVAAPPTAVFVASDTMAVGAYGVLSELGIAIPEDLSIVGYDDLPQAEFLSPPLTTVSTSHVEFGRLAGDLLVDGIHEPDRPPRELLIKPSLIIRESTTSFRSR